MVIDLPLEDIETYVRSDLAWLPLRSDEELLYGLQEMLYSTKVPYGTKSFY